MLDVNQLIGFGASGDGGKRFWRLSKQGANIYDSLGFTEVDMYAVAGATGYGLCSGGVVTASSEYDAASLKAYAFDHNFTTAWASVEGTALHWIVYEFPSGVNVAEIVVMTGTPIATTMPAFNVHSSEDGTVWLLEGSFSARTSTAGPEPTTGGTSYYSRYTL